MNGALRKIRVVLVNPQDSKNIGAVCRVIKTMDITSLYIVGGADIDFDQAAVLAIHAEDLLKKAVILSSLKEAVQDAVLVAGITRRRGKKRKYFALSPEALADKIASIEGVIALVFGNEISGLNDQDLSLCHLAVKIPSSNLFPSLNLSHAVQIITYQIFKALSGPDAGTRYSPIKGAQLDYLMKVVLGSLKNIGFFTQVGQRGMGVFLRDIFARAALSGQEAKRMEALFRKISGLIAKKKISP